MNKKLDHHESIVLGLIAITFLLVAATFILVLGISSRQVTGDSRTYAAMNSNWQNFLNRVGGASGVKPGVRNNPSNPNYGAISDCSVCDLNGDGSVDSDDARTAIGCYVKEVCPEADLDGNGEVNQDDVTRAKEMARAGDAETLKKVMQCLRENRKGMQDGTVNSSCMPDVNGDGIKDKNDVSACVVNCALPQKKGSAYPTGIPNVTIPAVTIPAVTIPAVTIPMVTPITDPIVIETPPAN